MSSDLIFLKIKNQMKRSFLMNYVTIKKQKKN